MNFLCSWVFLNSGKPRGLRCSDIRHRSVERCYNKGREGKEKCKIRSILGFGFLSFFILSTTQRTTFPLRLMQMTWSYSSSSLRQVTCQMQNSFVHLQLPSHRLDSIKYVTSAALPYHVIKQRFYGFKSIKITSHFLSEKR